MGDKSDSEVTSRLNEFCHEARHMQSITGAMIRKAIRLYDQGPLANKKEIRKLLREINKQLLGFARFVENFRYSSGVAMSEDEDMKKIFELIIKHEGLRLKPYVDTKGKLTIGYGRNLTDVGISKREAKIMLIDSVRAACTDLDSVLGKETINKLSDDRYRCLVDMMFNLGRARFKTIKIMIGALKREDYKKASEEMLDSIWASQVGNRAKELAKMMLNG